MLNLSNLNNFRFKTKEEAEHYWDEAYANNTDSFLCFCYENEVLYVCYKIPKVAYIKFSITKEFAKVICGEHLIENVIKELSVKEPSSRFVFFNLIVRKLGLDYLKNRAKEYKSLL